MTGVAAHLLDRQLYLVSTGGQTLHGELVPALVVASSGVFLLFTLSSNVRCSEHSFLMKIEGVVVTVAGHQQIVLRTEGDRASSLIGLTNTEYAV